RINHEGPIQAPEQALGRPFQRNNVFLTQGGRRMEWMYQSTSKLFLRHIELTSTLADYITKALRESLMLVKTESHPRADQVMDLFLPQPRSGHLTYPDQDFLQTLQVFRSDDVAGFLDRILKRARGFDQYTGLALTTCTTLKMYLSSPSSWSVTSVDK